MKIEKQLDKKIKTIVQMTGNYPKEMEIKKEEYMELLKENMSAKEQFITIKNEDVYIKGVKLKIK